MVILSDGTQVHVRIAHHSAREYQFEKTVRGKTVTSTCFIEAKEGECFTIECASLPIRPGSISQATLSIDGKKLDRILSGCSATKESQDYYEFKGYRQKDEVRGAVYRAFTFSKMQTTSDASAKKLPVDELNEACTIRIEIVRKYRHGEIAHNLNTAIDSLPPATIIHEDSKPALWGLSASPGKILDRRKGYKCFCMTSCNPDAVTDIIIFKYRPNSWLVATDLLIPPQVLSRNREQEDDGDDVVVVDEHRTERAATLRRAREAESMTTRKQRLKRMIQLKREATVKQEESSREIDVVDLTPDGEYIPPSRKIGETIVLGDNTDEED